MNRRDETKGMEGTMTKKKMVTIDKDKLKNAVRRRKKTNYQASMDMGYSHSMISQWCSNGQIPIRGMKLLEEVHGICPEEYTIPDDPESQLVMKEVESNPSLPYVSNTITIEFSDETLERMGKMLAEAIWNAGVNLK